MTSTLAPSRLRIAVDVGGNLLRAAPAEAAGIVHSLTFADTAEVLETGTNAAGFDHLVIRDGFRHVYAVAVPDAPVLARSVAAAHLEAVEVLRVYGGTRVVRTWNYVGRINEPNHDGLERYRDFCVGRDRAYAAAGLLRTLLPAATGVGTAAGGVVSIVFAEPAHVRVEAIENPLQVPAFRYPRSYGPASPSFSRALLRRDADSELTFVSGTASILGHDSRGDTLTDQLGHTVHNLGAVIDAARARATRSGGRWREIKAYVRRPADLATVRRELINRLGVPAAIVTAVVADICRAELLVEVEGSYEHITE
ncbi:hypothetical protein GFY24_19655 [Nocardia sp. SYP-A9097]|uniref:chorismate transformation enzyme, FkbO/Hyg5 family n=1 Tax=Nocardia sp. SYP-A9097 TaxID=2663237 RepID=UPI00129BAD3E|nr:hypothetical protein [Nocardia sp. SYP-A9097]MRH89632.1 hypothetical protein [Nocardia sp. SYP-A9097]